MNVWVRRLAQATLRGGLFVARRLDRVDVFVFGGLGLMFVGAALVDLAGALLLIGALLTMIGIQAAKG